MSILASAKAAALLLILSVIFFCYQSRSSRVHHQDPRRLGIKGISGPVRAWVPGAAIKDPSAIAESGSDCITPIPRPVNEIVRMNARRLFSSLCFMAVL